MTRLPPLPRWSPSTDRQVRAVSGGRVRLLTDADTGALAALSSRAPVSNVFVDSLLEAGRLAGPRGGAGGTLFLGIDDAAPVDAVDAGGAAAPEPEGTRPARVLRAAVWVGSNVVPVASAEDPDAGWAPGDAEALGAAVVALRRRFGSLYGPAGPVLAVGRALAAAGHRARSVREDQPLLVLGPRSAVEAAPHVVQAHPRDFERVLPASAAMFEEELGFSPFLGGAAQYRDRVERLIRSGRVFIDPGPADAGGPLRFKADIGLLSSRCAQIQGVWMAPAARGRGLAATAMAAVVDYVRLQAPVVSLYVNAYNTPALRTYERVGFERRGTFATVLY